MAFRFRSLGIIVGDMGNVAYAAISTDLLKDPQLMSEFGYPVNSLEDYGEVPPQ